MDLAVADRRLLGQRLPVCSYSITACELHSLTKEVAVKAILAMATLIMITLSAQPQSAGTVIVGGKETPTEDHFALMVSGSYSYPQELFGDSYEPSYGSALSIGSVITPEGMTNLHVGTKYLSFCRDLVLLRGPVARSRHVGDDTKATILSIHAGAAEGQPLILSRYFALTPLMGEGLGGSQFSIPQAVYESFGDSTLTELKHENDEVQLSHYRRLGVLVSGLENVSLQYSYDLMSVERTWMTFHSMISGAISDLIIDGVPRAFRTSLPEEVSNSIPFGLTLLAYKAIASYLWYEFDYDHHNWPFEDAPPLHYHRQVLALNYAF